MFQARKIAGGGRPTLRVHGSGSHASLATNMINVAAQFCASAKGLNAMRTPFVAVLVTFIIGGCDGLKGPAGPQGPAGNAGSAGPRGESGGMYIYVDANGTEVDTDQSLIWTDENGWQWHVRAASATVTAHAALQTEWYTSTDCTGDAYANDAYLPRQPITRVAGGYWVREDGASLGPVFVGSARAWGALECHQSQGHTVTAYPLVHVEGLVPPTLPYRPPLRLERRR